MNKYFIYYSEYNANSHSLYQLYSRHKIISIFPHSFLLVLTIVIDNLYILTY